MSAWRAKADSLLGRMADLDRRLIFLLVAVAMGFAVFHPRTGSQWEVDPDVRKVYEAVENLPEGSFIMVSAELDPANAPELYPQALAFMRHAFRRNHRVAVVYFAASAAGVVEELLSGLEKEFPEKSYGRDYVLLPYMPDYAAALTQMGGGIYAFYDRDARGHNLRELPVMAGINRLSDVRLAMVFSATTLLDNWVALASDRFGFSLAGGVTATIQPRYGPYLQTGQLVGLVGGMKGGADYEKLLGQTGGGAAGLDALNTTNLLALALVLCANMAVWLRRLL